MENFDVNKDYKVGTKLVFNGIGLTVAHGRDCNKCFFKGKCVDQRNFFPVCCEEQRADRQMVVFVESKDVRNG